MVFKNLYTEGLSIKSPLNIEYQIYAIESLRSGIEAYDRRHGLERSQLQINLLIKIGQKK